MAKAVGVRLPSCRLTYSSSSAVSSSILINCWSVVQFHPGVNKIIGSCCNLVETGVA